LSEQEKQELFISNRAFGRNKNSRIKNQSALSNKYLEPALPKKLGGA